MVAENKRKQSSKKVSGLSFSYEGLRHQASKAVNKCKVKIRVES
jgi:hypothetical protein